MRKIKKEVCREEALHSPLFLALQDRGVLLDEHRGGCVLYEKREQVEALLRKRCP